MSFELKERGRTLVCAAVIAVVVAAVFGQSVGFSFLNWDDPVFVLHANVVNWFDVGWDVRLTTPHAGYPIPIPTAVYGLLHATFEEPTAWPIHLVNVAVHLVNALLVFALVRRLDVACVPACLAALFWAIHPVVVEPVVWATGLKDVLSVTGVLMALHGSMKLRAGGAGLAAVALMVAGPIVAMGSKPTGVVVGPMMIAYFVLASDAGRHRVRGLVAGGVWMLAGVGVVGASFVSHSSYGGQDITAFSFGRMFRAVETAVRNYVVPLNLSPRYLYESADAVTWVVGGGLTIVVGLILWKCWRERPRIALGVCWAVIAFGPVSNLIPLNRFVADSYLYLPSVGGVVALAGWWRTRGTTGETTDLRRRIVAGLVVLVFGAITAIQVTYWKDSVSLWERATTTNPQDPVAHVNLGTAYFAADRFDAASEVFEWTDASFPDYQVRTADWPMAYCTTGRFRRCVYLLDELIARGPRDATAGGRRAWRHLLITYAMVCQRRECTIHDSLEANDRAMVEAAMDSFADGRAMKEVRRRIVEHHTAPESR